MDKFRASFAWIEDFPADIISSEKLQTIKKQLRIDEIKGNILSNSRLVVPSGKKQTIITEKAVVDCSLTFMSTITDGAIQMNLDLQIGQQRSQSAVTFPDGMTMVLGKRGSEEKNIDVLFFITAKIGTR